MVLQKAGYGNGIADFQFWQKRLHGISGTLHAVALYWFVSQIANDNRNGNILVSGIIFRIDLRDLTSQCVFLGRSQVGILFQGVQGVDDGFLRREGRCVLACTDRDDLVQRAVCVKFDGGLAGGIYIVLDDTGDLDDVGDLDLVRVVALHAVALDGLVFSAGDNDRDCDVLVVRVIRRIDLGDLACQSLFADQVVAFRQCVSRVNNLLVCAIILLLFAGADRDNLVQRAVCVKFDGGLAGGIHVVLQITGDLDDVRDLDLVRVRALHTVALDRLVGHVVDHDRDGNILIILVIRRVDLRDFTGQRVGLGLRHVFVGRKLIRRLNDLTLRIEYRRIIRDLFADIIDGYQRAAGGEFDGAVVVDQRTKDRDRVADLDRINAVALQAVAHDRHILMAVHNDRYGDVAVAGIIRRVDLGNDTGQSGILDLLIARQRIGRDQQVILADQLIIELDLFCVVSGFDDAFQRERTA